MCTKLTLISGTTLFTILIFFFAAAQLGTATISNTLVATNPVIATTTDIEQLSGTSTPVSTSTPTSIEPKKSADKPKNKPAEAEPLVSVKTTPTPQSPYSYAPESLESLDSAARAALVNVLCMPSTGTLRPISGSGVIIDPRGVILTNAHVAQYVLLSQNSSIDLRCSIRAGSPAAFKWKAKVLYIPSVWVEEHYTQINAGRSQGTGEHDYALLLLTADMQGNPIVDALPYLQIETRPEIVNEGDQVLVAGYAAEFAGGLATQQNLYAITSIAKIEKLLTFLTGSIDVFSVGGVLQAQSGSSGGPVINAWRRIVAIITTTSEGATTAERDLHTLSLRYIDSDLQEHANSTLEAILASDVARLADEFSRETAPSLTQKYMDILSR